MVLSLVRCTADCVITQISLPIFVFKDTEARKDVVSEQVSRVNFAISVGKQPPSSDIVSAPKGGCFFALLLLRRGVEKGWSWIPDTSFLYRRWARAAGRLQSALPGRVAEAYPDCMLQAPLTRHGVGAGYLPPYALPQLCPGAQGAVHHAETCNTQTEGQRVSRRASHPPPSVCTAPSQTGSPVSVNTATARPGAHVEWWLTH